MKKIILLLIIVFLFSISFVSALFCDDYTGATINLCEDFEIADVWSTKFSRMNTSTSVLYAQRQSATALTGSWSWEIPTNVGNVNTVYNISNSSIHSGGAMTIQFQTKTSCFDGTGAFIELRSSTSLGFDISPRNSVTTWRCSNGISNTETTSTCILNATTNHTIVFNPDGNGVGVSNTSWVMVNDSIGGKVLVNKTVKTTNFDITNSIDAIRFITSGPVITYANLHYFDNIVICSGVHPEGCPTAAPITGAPNPPTFVPPTPNDGKSNNTNQIINMSCGADDLYYYLWFDNTTSPLTIVLENTTLGNWTTDITTNGTYFYRGACFNITNGLFSVNSSERTYIMDTSSPTITVNPNTFFNATDDTSTTNQYLNTIIMNFTFLDDDNVFAMGINITKDGVSYFNYSNTSINELIHNFSKSLNISDWPGGVYDIELQVADGHHYIGGYQIGDYNIIKSTNKITFNTTEDNTISISSDGAYSTKYTREKNSYSFGFEYISPSSTRTFIIESKDGKIYHIPESRYKAHFVVWNGKHGNWIDFEGLDGTYIVNKINDYRYEITFSSLKFEKEVITRSIGGLNVVTENYQWYRGTYNVFAPEVYSRFAIDLILNITKNNTFINNVNVTISYNNTYRTFSQVDYGNYITYNATVIAPSVNIDSIVPYFWNITINQSNGNTYNFTITGNNSILSWGLDDCTNGTIPTLNISIKNISTNDYVNVNLNYAFEYQLGSLPYLLNFSGSLEGNNQTFCIFSNKTTILSNILFEYNLPGSSTLFDYFMYQVNLSNITQSLTLYTQEGTTQVLFTALDINSNPIANAYIHILKYDIATNSYKTVEILKTDSQGQTLGNMILGTAFYNFFIYYNGILVYTEQAVKLIATTRTFTINLVGIDWFDDFETTLGINTNLYFNNATNNFVYTWTDPTSSMHFACLKVDEMNRTGKFELNTTCVESTSGTILYNIPILNAGSTYTGTGYLKFDFPMITDVVTKLVTPLSSFFSVYPFMGLFIALLFCITMVMIGLPKPSLSITLLGIGVLICSLLGLWAISLMQVTSIIFLIIIQLYLKGRSQ